MDECSSDVIVWHAALPEAPPVPRWDLTCISDLVLHRRMSQYDPRCRSSQLHHQQLQADMAALLLRWRRRRADITLPSPLRFSKPEHDHNRMQESLQ